MLANRNTYKTLNRRWHVVYAARHIPKEDAMVVKKELLDILACPKCKGDIHLNDTDDGLICENCKLLYEIRDDIPIMLIDEAKPID
jgi:uncharacterized protein YbaR (Trm112 family)